jgi:hypothetical protein
LMDGRIGEGLEMLDGELQGKAMVTQPAIAGMYRMWFMIFHRLFPLWEDYRALWVLCCVTIVPNRSIPARCGRDVYSPPPLPA